MSRSSGQHTGTRENTVRIIAGQWRRLLLRFPDSAGLRPTPDRVRETLFNWLGQELHGLHCLDLFAGSGALGFEAASRGAARVVMLEQSPTVRAALLENCKTLKAFETVEILGGDALEFAARQNGRPVSERFDVLFLDPPYRLDWLKKLAPLLDSLLKPDGWLYVEAEMPVVSLGDWQQIRQGKAGQVYYQLLMRQAPPETRE